MEIDAGHEFVYGELILGDRGGPQKLLNTYARMQQVPAVPHSDVVAFVRARKIHGPGIGWIDVHLLASARSGDTARPPPRQWISLATESRTSGPHPGVEGYAGEGSIS